MTDKVRKRVNIAIVSTVVVVAAVAAVFLLWKPSKNITTFAACKDAGGAILESYPEQCLLNGQSFVNDAQQNGAKTNNDGYVGLTEQAALDKAKSDGKTARIVERNGESLPVTMDLMFGRLNFYINDDKVYKVQVEGER